jgi:hypothetical protein
MFNLKADWSDGCEMHEAELIATLSCEAATEITDGGVRLRL